jgi:hypothetical protein
MYSDLMGQSEVVREDKQLVLLSERHQRPPLRRVSLQVIWRKNDRLYTEPTGNMAWSQLKTLLGGLVDGLTGFSDLKNMFSWDAIVGITQFGNALISGQISLMGHSQIGGSVVHRAIPVLV